MRGIGVVVLVAGLQTVASQVESSVDLKIPIECFTRLKTDVRPTDCCIIPPFFADVDFTACGFKKFHEIDPNKPHEPPSCSKQLCILSKYNLLDTDSEEINATALREYMDQWAGKHPDFLPAIGRAKDQCVGRPLPGPPQICQANKLVFCVSATLFDECPTWKNDEDCSTLRKHINHCKPYFRKAAGH